MMIGIVGVDPGAIVETEPTLLVVVA
jgi:hypothetical protein